MKKKVENFFLNQKLQLEKLKDSRSYMNYKNQIY